MTRLLRLLGFSFANIANVLTPQRWENRSLSVGAMPNISLGGYAKSVGTWPVEFNRPSIINCGNHTWEYSGYPLYSKGLPKYQDSQLTLRQRFDFLTSEVWGGLINTTGQNEQGEFIITGKAISSGGGKVILEA
jgi:hypothetical protein